MPTASWTARQYIDRFVPRSPPGVGTVDGFLAGSPDTPLTGVATCFAASQDALERAAAEGANLVVTHEGMYYSHQEAEPSAFAGDPVVRAKRTWLERSGLVVFRSHDGVHRCRPDLVTEGLLEALGWQRYLEERLPAASVVRLPAPAVELKDLIVFLKRKLGLPFLRAAGDPSARCSGVGVAVGYRGGGATAIPLLGERDLDVVIAGEGPEWETPEYVFDALHQGRRKALVLLGHAASEEPGMRRLAARLAAECPEIPAWFVPGRRTLSLF